MAAGHGPADGGVVPQQAACPHQEVVVLEHAVPPARFHPLGGKGDEGRQQVLEEVLSHTPPRSLGRLDHGLHGRPDRSDGNVPVGCPAGVAHLGDRRLEGGGQKSHVVAGRSNGGLHAGPPREEPAVDARGQGVEREGAGRAQVGDPGHGVGHRPGDPDEGAGRGEGGASRAVPGVVEGPGHVAEVVDAEAERDGGPQRGAQVGAALQGEEERPPPGLEGHLDLGRVAHREPGRQLSLDGMG